MLCKTTFTQKGKTILNLLFRHIPRKISIYSICAVGTLLLICSLIIFSANGSQTAAGSELSATPGLGSNTFTSEELFEPVGRITSVHGHASVAMVNGYLLAVYSTDGGGNLDDGGVDLYDISDPHNPKKVNSIESGTTHELREAHSLSFSSSYNGRDYMVLQAMHGLQIWDVTEAPNVWLHNYMILPGIREDDYFGAWWIFWQAPYIYLAGVEQGLYIIDATDINNPELVKQVSTTELGGLNPAQVFIVGNMMVLASNVSAELATVDISDPLNPKVIQNYRGHDAYSHTFAAGKIFGSGGRRGPQRLNIYDVSHAGAIQEYGSIGEGVMVQNGGYGTYQDGYFFAGFSQGVYKFDVANKRLEGGWHRDWTDRDYDFGIVLGNLMFAGEDHFGISELVVHQTEPDTRGPEVHWIHPADGAHDLAVTTRVGLSMSDNVDISSVTAETFMVRPLLGDAIPGKFSSQLGIVNFFPDAPLLNGVTYEVITEGILDYSGNPSPKFTSRFTVGDPATVTLDCSFELEPALVGEPIPFAGQDNPNGTIYQWHFGDGEISNFLTSASTSHSYQHPGRYRVSLNLQRSTLQEKCVGIQIVTQPATDQAPVSSGTVVLDENQLVTVNRDNNTVTAIDKNSFEKLWEQPVCDRPETIALALADELWVACSESDQMVRLNAQTGSTIATINFPYGSQPHSVAFAPDQSAAYVTLYGSGELAKLNSAGQIIERLTVGPTPRSISISGDGNRLLISRYISPLLTGEIVEVNGESFEVERTHPLAFDPGHDHESGGRGVLNYVGQTAISPDGLSSVIPAKKDNIARGEFKDGRPLTFESQVRPVVARLDLETNRENRLERIDLDNEALPQSVVYSPLGDLIFVANMGSNSIHVYDSVSHALISEITTDFAPQSMVIDAATGQLFAHNFLSRTLSVHDVSSLLDGSGNGASRTATVELVANEALAAEVLLGKQIFYNAADSKMSKDNYISCAVCHIDGDSDGRVWDSTQDGEGLRNTPSLLGKGGLDQGNLHWSGAFDELQDVENEIRERFAGSGFLTDADFATAGVLDGPLKTGRSSDLDALAAYVATLDQTGRSRFKTAAGNLTADAELGKTLFAVSGCATCHSGDQFTDSPAGGRHNIGSLSRGSGDFLIDTPTLRGLWSSAPYLHNGAAPDLPAAIEAHAWTTFTTTELDQLSSYLLQIDDQEPGAPAIDNQNPVLEGDWATKTGPLNDGVWIQVNATDPDESDTLTFGALGFPSGLGINSETGEIIGVASPAGRYAIKLFVTDGNGGADVAEFDWIIGETEAFPAGETHLCKATTNCDVELGWLRVQVPAGTFRQDVEIQARFDAPAVAATGSEPPEDVELLHPFRLLATSAITGQVVEPAAGKSLNVTYRFDETLYDAVSSFRLELVLRTQAEEAGLQSLKGDFADGAITFELDQLGDIGLIPGRNVIYLPFIR